MIWSPEQDALLVTARDSGRKFPGIAAELGVSKNAALARYHRLKRTVFGTRGISYHWYRNLAPASHPYAPDSSCPRFARNDAHCAAVLSTGAYPVMPRRAA